MRRAVTIAAAASIVIALLAPVGQGVAAELPPTVPASGTFSFTTANGILPTWEADDIALIGVSPGSVVTTSTGTTARVSLPIVAKTGSANAAAGGFRLTNTVTGESVRCANPVIDTRARVIDCVLADGTNEELFAITSIRSFSRVAGSSTTTSVFRGVTLRINGQGMADLLNEQLSTYAFSPFVTIGTGDLIVTRDRQVPPA